MVAKKKRITIGADVLWSEKELLRRFRLVDSDFCDMMETRISMSEKYTEEYREMYLDGIEDAVTEIGIILSTRFVEIAKQLEKETKEVKRK